MENHANHGSHGPPKGFGPGGHATLGGLSVDANGLRIVPTDTRFTPGEPIEWNFEIVTSDGEVVTEFDEAHGQRSHLIVVRRDLTRFQHLHPTLDANGTWRVEGFTLPDPGVYRAFVDLDVDGRPATLGFDLFASGTMETAPRPDTSRRAMTAGYDVELTVDEGRSDQSIQLTFEITHRDYRSQPDSFIRPYDPRETVPRRAIYELLR